MLICLWLCDQDNSNSNLLIKTKIGRTLSFYKRKNKFAFEKNRIDSTQTVPKYTFNEDRRH